MKDQEDSQLDSGQQPKTAADQSDKAAPRNIAAAAPSGAPASWDGCAWDIADSIRLLDRERADPTPFAWGGSWRGIKWGAARNAS
jgi:hypothetical protein